MEVCLRFFFFFLSPALFLDAKLTSPSCTFMNKHRRSITQPASQNNEANGHIFWTLNGVQAGSRGDVTFTIVPAFSEQEVFSAKKVQKKMTSSLVVFLLTWAPHCVFFFFFMRTTAHLVTVKGDYEKCHVMCLPPPPPHRDSPDPRPPVRLCRRFRQFVETLEWLYCNGRRQMIVGADGHFSEPC